MDFKDKAEEIYHTITTSWRGSQMLWPIKNKIGEKVNVVFYPNDTKEEVLKRLELWYSHKSEMVLIKE